MSNAILWFRRDLRLEDNPALDAALRAHDRVQCLYIDAPNEEAPWAPGEARRWRLHHSLAALDAALRTRGAALNLARGPTAATLDALLQSTQAQGVYWNRLYEPAAIARDAAIMAQLRVRGVEAHSFNAALLVEPWEIATGQGKPYRVFTPFWRNARIATQLRPPIPAPRSVPGLPRSAGLALGDLELLPRIDWAGGFRAAWRPGETGAQERLQAFG